MNKISIIITIYNVEKYLPTCIESIMYQTYKNLEMILVNDGSTDSCSQICNAYAEKDNRIKVIHKKNGGLSDARNVGLKQATGDLVSFVDSDDFVSPYFYQKLLNALIENNADIAECGFLKFEKDSKLNEAKIDSYLNAEIYETEKALDKLLIGPLSIVVWNKIYNKELLEGIEFPVNKINEDEYWTYKVVAKAKKIVKIQDELYFYRQQATSIMGSGYSLKRLDGLHAHEERLEYLKKQFPKLEQTAIRTYCFSAMFHYHQILINQEIDPEKIYRDKIYGKVEIYYKWSVLKNWHWKDIIWFLLFIYSPKNYMRVREYMDRKVERRLNKE